MTGRTFLIVLENACARSHTKYLTFDVLSEVITEET